MKLQVVPNNISPSLKKTIERRFFHCTFKTIKNHPALSKLSLTDEEIVQNRYEIKQVMQSWQECGESKVFCLSLNPHYCLKRNQDNQLIIVCYQCTKQKNYEDMMEEEVNKKIKDCLKETGICFNLEDVKQIINNYKDLKHVPEIIRDKGIGKTEYSLKNIFFGGNTEDKNRHIIYLFHAILIGMDIMVMRSEKLKRLMMDQWFSKEREEYDPTVDKINKVSLLIILDFGIEGSIGKNYYFFDIIPDILESRNLKGKITFVFSPVNYKAILNDIKENSYYCKSNEANRVIQEARLGTLKNTLQRIFNNQRT